MTGYAKLPEKVSFPFTFPGLCGKIAMQRKLLRCNIPRKGTIASY